MALRRIRRELPSPAETLRAYSFFYEDRLLGRRTALFVLAEVSLFALYLLLAKVRANVKPLDQLLAPIRVSAFVAGVLIASYWGAFLHKRSCRLARLRRSLWEEMINIYCAGKTTLIAAIAAPILAVVVWIVLAIAARPKLFAV